MPEITEEVEKRWTRDRPTVRGWYWVRYPHANPVVIHSRDQDEYLDYCEFLGPITPDDLSQRDALLAQMKVIRDAFWSDCESDAEKVDDLQNMARAAIQQSEREP